MRQSLCLIFHTVPYSNGSISVLSETLPGFVHHTGSDFTGELRRILLQIRRRPAPDKCLHISTAFASHFAAPHHIDPARSVGFNKNREEHPGGSRPRIGL